MPRSLAFVFLLFVAPSLTASDSGKIPLSDIHIAAYAVSPVFKTAAASSGTSSLVAFESRVMQVYPETSSIYFRVYASGGTALQPVVRRAGVGVSPSVVWNGSEYLIVWAIPSSRFATGAMPAVGALRVAADGTTIGSPVVLATSSERPSQSAVAWNGAKYLVTAGRVALFASGDLQTKTMLPPLSSSAVASDGDRFLIVDSAGAVVVMASDGTPVASTNLGRSGEVAITYGRGRYGVIVTSTDGVHRMTVTRNGEVADVITLIATAGQSPAITASGDSFVAVWVSDDDLWFGRFGAGDHAVLLSARPHLQMQPVLASDERGMIVGWAEASTANESPMVLIAFTRDDALPELNDIRTVTEFAVPQLSPVIARDARGAVIGWLETSDIFVGGIDDSGAVRPGRLIVPSGAMSRVSLRAISAGNETLILWIEQSPRTTAEARVRAIRLDSESKPIDPIIEIGMTSASDTAGVAFDGQSWVIVWQSAGRIVATRVRPDGSIIGPGTLVAETGVDQRLPDVACGDKGCVAVWSEAQLPISGERIQAAKINGGGESFTVAFALENITYPSIAWNGDQFLTAWLRDYDGGLAVETRAARLDDRGRRFFPADEQGFLIATDIGAAPRVRPYAGDAFVVFPAVALVAATGDSAQRIAATVFANDGVTAGRRLMLASSEKVPLTWTAEIRSVVDEVERVFARIVEVAGHRRSVSRH